MSPQKLTAYQFDALCDSVRDAAKSLGGCKSYEIPNELRILRVQLDKLCHADLARKNPRLAERRADIIRRANAVIADREQRAPKESEVQFVDVDQETAYCTTTRLPFQIRVF